MFCANYKVGEGFEFSREELGVKDKQQIDFEVSYIKEFQNFRLKGFPVWWGFIVMFEWFLAYSVFRNSPFNFNITK